MADKGPINYSPIYVMYVIALTIEIQYTVSTYNLGERFTRLNKNLESLLKSSKFYDYSRKDYAPGKYIEKIGFKLIILMELLVEDSIEQRNFVAHTRLETEYRENIKVYRTPKISDWLSSEGGKDN